MFWWLYIIFILIASTVLFSLHAFVYAVIWRVFDIYIPFWYLLLGLLSVSFFLGNIAVRTIKSVVADWFYFLVSSWLGIIFLLFSVTVVYELFHLVTSIESQFLLGGLLITALLLAIYALLQGRHLMIKEYKLHIKDLARPLRVVHLSDIHVGTVHQTHFLERVIEKTNSLEPDIVLITGDLFDGSAPIDENILHPLNKLTAPSYFSNGNHEEYEGLVKVKETIQNLDMELLDNRSVVQNGVQIIGVNDRQSIPRNQTLGSILEKLPLDHKKPSILMYHSPYEWNHARSNGIDIMLSGHTHGGQIYPMNLLVRLFFRYTNGLYKKDNFYLHVSPGTGTWGPPMRLGSRNQITLLKILPTS